MIYILVGNETKKKSDRIKVIAKGGKPTSISAALVSVDLLQNYAASASLFGDLQIIIVENIITEGGINFSASLLLQLQNSPTIFVFSEDKLLASNEKKYKKYVTIERFEAKTTTSRASKFNTFVIADAFGRHDKAGAWILYRDAIEAGIDPEPISGILFWKIKTMMLGGGNSLFSLPTLKKQSSALVSLYHRAHRGELDFVVGLEEFILSSLSK